MKKLLMALTLMISLTLAVTASADLIGYWNFNNGSSSDSSGNNYHGTDTNVTYSSDVPFKFFGQSADLRNNGYILINHSIEAGSDPFYVPALTVSCWVKGWPDDSWEPFVSKLGDDEKGWQIRRISGDYTLSWTLRGTNDPDWWGGATYTPADMWSGWHQITAIYDNANGRREIWVDGVQRASATYTGAVNHAAAHVCIGARQRESGSIDGQSNVMIDEVRIYNHALSASEITALLLPDKSPLTATNPVPADGAIDLDVDAGPITLQWTNSDDPSIAFHQVYLGTDWMNMGLVTPAGGDPNLAPSVNSIQVTLQKDKHYYWRVDEITTDPNHFYGSLWQFETEKTLPKIISQPDDALADEGGIAEFTIDAIDILGNDLSYSWNKGKPGDPLDPVGTDSPKLTIENVTYANDNGDTYYCIVENASGPTASQTAKIIVKAMLGHWSLNGNTNDLTVFQNHGIAINGTAVYANDVPGDFVTQSLNLTSANYLLQIPNEAHFDTTYENVTVMCWYKDNGSSDWRTFVSKNGEATAWQLRRHGGSATVDWTLRGAGGDNEGNGAFNDGKWHHLAGTFDSSRKAIYLDGICDSMRIQPGPMSPNDQPVAIGGRFNPDPENYCRGWISEVRIYNYAMTPEEIATVYNLYTGNCIINLPGDTNGDCIVDINDLQNVTETFLGVN